MDEEESINTIQLAIKRGVNYIDTAYWYGQGDSERLLGKALKDVPRQAYYLATKVGRYELDTKNRFDFSARKTKESIDRSLKFLNLDYVDIVQIHDIEFAPNINILLNETLPALEEIVKEGKARFIGITGYPTEVIKKFIEAAPDRIHMILSYARYTLIDQSLVDYLDFFKALDIGVVCASGHGMGLLTNNGPQAWHPASAEIKQKCKEAAEICKANNVELARLAMAFFIALKGPATFLVGMQTRTILTMNLNVMYEGLNECELQLQEKLLTSVFSKIKHKHWEGVEVDSYRKKLCQ